MSERWRVSPDAFRRIALWAVVALALTIVSGAAVRLTGSGLGCDTWPQCDTTSVVAPWHFHAWVEFGNRLINAVVTIASLGTFVAAVRRRPRRPDLTWLSFGLVIGLIAEVVIGAVVVYSKLDPILVSIHFLLGLAFLAVAVVLHQRARLTDDHGPATPMVSPAVTWAAGAMMAALAVVVTLGTVVTSTGPHGGSPGTPRYHLSLHSVAQWHGSSAEVFLAVCLLTIVLVVRTAAPKPVLRRAELLLAATVAQAAVGYTQYLNGDPVGIVAVHVAGASLLVVAAIHFWFGLWDHRPTDPVPEPDAAALASVGAGTVDAGA
jgi:cytochrome c oxidase assembly protein subunit 15